MGFNEKLNCEKAMERNASPFVAHDPILHYAKTLEEGISWAIPSDFHAIGHSTLFNFVFPPTKLKTTMITGAWQSPIVQPTFPNPIVNNPNVIRGPHASNQIVERTTQPLHTLKKDGIFLYHDA
jgi:hypothetical protein